jgi:hypothetical protein
MTTSVLSTPIGYCGEQHPWMRESWDLKERRGCLGCELWSGICNTSKSNAMEVSSLMGQQQSMGTCALTHDGQTRHFNFIWFSRWHVHFIERWQSLAASVRCQQKRAWRAMIQPPKAQIDMSCYIYITRPVSYLTKNNLWCVFIIFIFLLLHIGLKGLWATNENNLPQISSTLVYFLRRFRTY